MTRRAPRLAVIAIDGTDPQSIARYADAGWLPELAGRLGQARQVELQSLADLFLNSPWACALSGIAVENHGIHAFRPIKSGTCDILEAAEWQMPTPFWETAVRAGLRANVLDAPLYGPPPGSAALDGLRFLEWGAHPMIRAAGSFPPSLVGAIEGRHGPHPLREDDAYLTAADELTACQERLCEGVRVRERIVLDMLDNDPPDLLVATFTELHIAGHQFLNLTAPGHPRFDSAVAAELGDKPLRRVFEAVDAAAGKILRRLAPDTTVLVLCMGGVRVSHGASFLLDDVLRKVGITAPARSAPVLAQRLWHLLPTAVRKAIKRQAPDFLLRQANAQFWNSLDWTATRAFALPWAYDGYLRINQRGREPHGIVADGAERAALLGEIEAIVSELRIVGTDKPAAHRIVRTQDAYRGRASAELPDLRVLWRNDEPIEAVESSRVGRIPNRDTGPRGAHTNPGVIFAWGPGIAAGPAITDVRDIDFAPTVLALLGITPPEGLDGRVVADLLRQTESVKVRDRAAGAALP
jgi:predicted AlkP superfamily phosphohydrolase/phosphomutase